MEFHATKRQEQKMRTINKKIQKLEENLEEARQKKLALEQECCQRTPAFPASPWAHKKVPLSATTLSPKPIYSPHQSPTPIYDPYDQYSKIAPMPYAQYPIYERPMATMPSPWAGNQYDYW
jgi:hypothetical protein